MKKISSIQKVIILLFIPTIFLGGYQYYSEYYGESVQTELTSHVKQEVLKSNPNISEEELALALKTTDSDYLDNYWNFENWMYLGLWVFILIVAFFLFKKQ
jgi:hypothetical protein